MIMLLNPGREGTSQPVLCFETSPTYIAEIENKQRVRVKLGSGKVQQEHDTAMCFTPIEK